MTLSQGIALLRRLIGRSGFDAGRHFGKIYRENAFGGLESRSGLGSSLAETARIRQALPGLLADLGVRRLLDAPCGDCHWIGELDWQAIEYTGADVVPELIEANRARLAGRGLRFVVADLCTDDLPRSDLILCRDCWVHLDYRQIRACLRNFQRSGATFLLTTTFAARPANRDLRAAIWRPLNLQQAPLRFPAPLRLVDEGCTEGAGAYADKALGLWRLKDLSF